VVMITASGVLLDEVEIVRDVKPHDEPPHWRVEAVTAGPADLDLEGLGVAVEALLREPELARLLTGTSTRLRLRLTVGTGGRITSAVLEVGTGDRALDKVLLARFSAWTVPDLQVERRVTLWVQIAPGR